ncbi:carbohydrate deacetylase-like [Hydractinia symbiolongicarpus]|uniref:carbohydrate deacetylase-like n=1 Tax=Hydractinia symbiolongicarpus TaxID=13093 RepID=UPI00254FEE94|nr:carbohydrate deacetylase-like [Hydractinia symbiolongicarpus]
MSTINSYLGCFKITADDFGYCDERNRGILDAVKEGVVNSVSVLMNASAVESINNKNIAVGLHLNLTEGRPVAQPCDVASLLDKEGHFFDKLSIAGHIKGGRILRVHVDIEIESQIKKFMTVFGHTPFYIDGHQHVHILPVIIDGLIKLMKKYEIKETRVPEELKIADCYWIAQPRLGFYLDVCCNAREARKCFNRHSISFPNYFIGLSTMSQDMNEKYLSKALNIISEDISRNRAEQKCRLVEIMTHPGYPNQNGKGGCSEKGPDSFSCSPDRKCELNFLKSHIIKDILNDFIMQTFKEKR